MSCTRRLHPVARGAQILMVVCYLGVSRLARLDLARQAAMAVTIAYDSIASTASNSSYYILIIDDNYLGG